MSAQFAFAIWMAKSILLMIFGSIALWAAAAPALRYARKINLVSRRTR